MGEKTIELVAHARNSTTTKQPCPEEEREERDSEREVPRGTGRCCVTTSRESPSPPSGVSPGVEVSSVSPASSTRRPGESSRCSSRTSSVMPRPTPSTPGGRPSPPWTSSTPSRGREGPSTDSVDKCLSATSSEHFLDPAEKDFFCREATTTRKKKKKKKKKKKFPSSS